MVHIEATFQGGTDKNFKRGRKYVLRINDKSMFVNKVSPLNQEEKEKVGDVSIPYESLHSFLKNWNKINVLI